MYFSNKANDQIGWRIEAWRRIDTRIGYQDILDRQTADPEFGGIGLKKLTTNALQNHCRRACRKTLNSWVDYGRRDESHRTEVEAIEELNYDNIVYNTVLMESQKFPGRLVKLTFQQHTEDGLWHAEPMEVTQANVRDTTYDLNHFRGAALQGTSSNNFMTKSMIAAWGLSILLQERADLHGKSHWSKLGKGCLPVTWFDRVRQDKRTAANSTYDGGCSICTWTAGREDAPTLVLTNKGKQKYTSRKRLRTASDSTSDGPLLVKRKRGRSTKVAADNNQENAGDEAIEEDAPDSTSNPAFMTPARQVTRVTGKDGNDYHGEDEPYDDDDTQGMLSSGVRLMCHSFNMARY